MSRDLAIDLGTANTLVYAKGKGLVLNEPTVVALDSRSREVLAIGTDAWQMIGRTPGYIVAERPLRGGAITDFEVTERMLSVLLRRVGVGRLNRPKVLICVPSAITAVERRAVKEAARRAGASASFLIEQPMAAAIGAGLPIHEPVGNMVVDVGGGTAEMAVISLGGVVAVQALRCGGFDFDASIQAYVRHHYGWPSESARPRRSSWPSGPRRPTRGSSRPRSAAARSRPECPRRCSSPHSRSGARSRTTCSRSSRRRPTASPRPRPSWPRTSCSRGSI